MHHSVWQMSTVHGLARAFPGADRAIETPGLPRRRYPFQAIGRVME